MDGSRFTSANTVHTINGASLSQNFNIAPLKSARVCTSSGFFSKGFGIIKSNLQEPYTSPARPSLIVTNDYFEWSSGALTAREINNSQPF